MGGSPIIESHPYTGLRVKIGISKHPAKRVRELQTGTSDRLILHALEPGDRELRKRHIEFSDHRKRESGSCVQKPLQTIFY